MTVAFAFSLLLRLWRQREFFFLDWWVIHVLQLSDGSVERVRKLSQAQSSEKEEKFSLIHTIFLKVISLIDNINQSSSDGAATRTYLWFLSRSQQSNVTQHTNAAINLRLSSQRSLIESAIRIAGAVLRKHNNQHNFLCAECENEEELCGYQAEAFARRAKKRRRRMETCFMKIHFSLLLTLSAFHLNWFTNPSRCIRLGEFREQNLSHCSVSWKLAR